MSSSSRRRERGLDVAVVGAGMVGSAMALGLAQAGFRVALIEARQPDAWRAEDEMDLRVVALAESSRCLLQRLGVWTSIAQSRASAYRRMHVWDGENGAALHFDAAERGEADLGHIVENRLIQHALWQALVADGRVDLRCPASVVATEEDSDVRTLELDDGTRLAARLVIAADGGASPLRTMLGIGTRGRDYAQRGVVAHVGTQRAHEATAWQRFLPGGPLAFLPLADGRSSIVWSLAEADAERMLAMSDEEFAAELGCAFDFRLGPITQVSRRAAFPLQLQLAEHYLAPRFALLGDAAHQVHPLAGQGVNLGYRDVAELLDLLIAARDDQRDFSSETTLRRYERRRRSDNALSAWGFDAIGRAFNWQAEPLVFARGLGVRALNALSPLKRLLIDKAAGRL
jgi:2-octaprenylphenol hydroxylase